MTNPPLPPDQASGHPRVLVAEDAALNRKIIGAMLAKLGVPADLVEDGHAVLAAVRQTPYGLVFMDCHMPGMDGFEATSAIRRMDPPLRDLPIVALTASSGDEDREACKQAGMNDFLSKPVQPAALQAMLQRWALAR